MLRMTTLYRRRSDGFFDMTYYLETHMPMAAALLAEHGFIDYQVQLPTAGLDGSEPDYYCIAHSDFTSLAALRAGLAAHGAELKTDFARYTNCVPEVVLSTVQP